MKKIISLFFVVLVLFCAICPAVMATDSMTNIQPYYVQLTDFKVGLSLKSGGVVHCVVSANSLVPSDIIKLYINLEKLSGSNWVTVSSWQLQGTNYAVFQINHSLQARGTYRLNAIAHVFDSNGNLLENESSTSKLVTH